MPATFIQDGDAIDYTPSADVAAGAVVVLEDLIGVTKRPIPANTLGTLDVTGVFEFPKETGSGSEIAAGAIVNWDALAQVAYAALGGSGSSGGSGGSGSSGGDKLLGKTVLAASDSDETVRVRLTQ